MALWVPELDVPRREFKAAAIIRLSGSEPLDLKEETLGALVRFQLGH